MLRGMKDLAWVVIVELEVLGPEPNWTFPPASVSPVPPLQQHEHKKGIFLPGQGYSLPVCLNLMTNNGTVSLSRNSVGTVTSGLAPKTLKAARPVWQGYPRLWLCYQE